MTTETILIALCLTLLIESIGPLLFPNRWQRYLAKLSKEPAKNIQTVGLVLFAIASAGLLLLLN